ncbi:30S ribosomal protein S15 [Nitzschia inconspicua]|uniref:30S ribosomal protein S15 n=1 Tax=Nitzschia inconspicua TaxID=303405 RepID=A0A9K3M3K2_9STRA|nr:30S ribosomal protein S15 [Nitzschia inconspicua]
MMLSRGILAVVLLADAVGAFSPSGRSSAAISQMVEERQRYQPRSSPIFVGEDVVAADDDVDDIMMTPDIDSPPEDDYIVNVGDLEEGDDDGSEDDGEPPAWAASEQRMQELRAEHRRNENDTGSPEFQIAGMTERINYLTKHLQQHPKDFSTRRGLVAMVNKRRRLLNYLSRENEDRYTSIVEALGIRHKAPGRVANRDEKYSRFPKQKAVKKHLLKKK